MKNQQFLNYQRSHKLLLLKLEEQWVDLKTYMCQSRNPQAETSTRTGALVKCN